MDFAGAAGSMSSVADNDPRNDPATWSSTVLLVGRFLTILRLVTIGCLVAVVAQLAQTNIVKAPPWADPLVGGALLVYAVGAVLLVVLLQLVRSHPFWLVELGLLLDGVILIFIALNTSDVLGLFVLLPILAVGIMRGLATALAALAAGIFVFLLQIALLTAQIEKLKQFATWPLQTQVLTLGLFMVLMLLWVSMMAGSSAALVRQHARIASQKAEQATE